MVFFGKRKIKTFLYLFCIIVSIILIYMKLKSPLIQISKTEDKSSSKQMLTIEQKPLYNGEIEIYKKTKEEKDFTKMQKEENKENKNTNDEITIDMPDKAKPENVTDIKSMAVDDYLIINFKEAKDIGTEYEYYIETKDSKNKISSDILNIISKSGIKGYSYVIDNCQDTQAGYEINKDNSDPILFNKLQWDKDYYLHIRAIDGNGNASNNLTYKIDLPSSGIRMQYIDVNTNSEISPEESIIGNVNEEYNVKDYNKNIQNYTLIEIEGEEQSKLKKEKINIKYKYAKNSTIKISYYDKTTNKKINEDEYINGYEGKEYSIKVKNIPGYKYNCSGNELNGKMIAGIQEIKIYYDKMSSINIEYVDILTKQKIIPDEKITDIVGSIYKLENKDISGYDLEKAEGITQGKITNEEINVTFYYKQRATMFIKHIDIDTNEVLFNEKIDGYVGDDIKINSKEFEGYILNDNYEKYKKSKNNSNNESKNKPKPSKASNKNKTNLEENLVQNSLKSSEDECINIIDELLTEENIDVSKNEESNNENYNYIQTIQEYDIVIRCNNDEYIIYYKKI